MNPEDETSDQVASEGTTDGELFDTAVDVGSPADVTFNNPNADT